MDSTEPYVTEPQRKIPVIADVDICVLGGSCTGVFAAVRAARLGASVALVEKMNCFGGVATSAMVNTTTCCCVAGHWTQIPARLGRSELWST
jgi:heterodisulfide reductase subunit A-like polyferredoxin